MTPLAVDHVKNSLLHLTEPAGQPAFLPSEVHGSWPDSGPDRWT
jgi:hypothetical protein